MLLQGEVKRGVSNTYIMSDNAKLIVKGDEFEFPLQVGTEQEVAIDIKKLRGSTEGVITLDPGFKNTGSCKSEITFLNGEEGVLRYRGYDIEELANKASFLEVSYLVIFGELPTKEQLENFEKEVNDKSFVNEEMKKIVDGFPRSAHPMGILSSMTSALTAFYPAPLDVSSEDAVFKAVVRSLGKFPVLGAWAMRKRNGWPLGYTDSGLNYIENLLKLLFEKPSEKFVPNQKVVTALNKLLILHIDHEQNCSTSTVRLIGSSHAGLHASISGGVSALWGPLHGGANQAVLEMLEAIQNDGGDVDKYLAKAKDKNDPFRLMGFGHRVYKNFDPRARIIKSSADEVLAELGVDDPLLDIAMKLEQAALNDEYFKARKLYPNVDFYSGIIYRALGIPVEMFTVMFAIGRLPGWIAQWLEMRKNNEPIGRPRQLYVGNTQRDFVTINKR
jgi:citrate synthase